MSISDILLGVIILIGPIGFIARIISNQDNWWSGKSREVKISYIAFVGITFIVLAYGYYVVVIKELK